MDWDELFMRQVYLIAQKSKDPSTKIGAVLVKNRIALISGFNGFPRGVNDLPERYDDRNIKYSMVSHGELNSITNAARNGIKTFGCILFSQGIPCNECAKSVIQAGIIEVVYHKQWSMAARWKGSSDLSLLMFKEASVKIRELDLKLGIQGFSDGKFINV